MKEENKQTAANELTLDSVGGIFVVLIAGMGIACVISVLEFMWKGGSLEKKVSFVNKTLILILPILVKSEAQLPGDAGSIEHKFEHVQHCRYQGEARPAAWHLHSWQGKE